MPLLQDCVQQLKRPSSHDYEKVLGGSVEAVWSSLATCIDHHMHQKKGVSVAALGEFAFVRDLVPLTPIFLLSESFIRRYPRVRWKRPPPLVITPTTELSMTVIGSDIAIPKDQVGKTVDAITEFLGRRLEQGTAMGKIRVGSIGSLCLDGATVSFVFDAAYIKGLVSIGVNDSGASSGVWTKPKIEESDARSKRTLLSRAVSLNVLTPSTEGETENQHRHHKHKHKRHHYHHHQRSHSTTLLTPTESPPPTDTQVLPRFLIPGVSEKKRQGPRTVSSTFITNAYMREMENLKTQIAMSKIEDEEILRRNDATQWRYLLETAEKTVHQRELNKSLHRQIEQNKQKQELLRQEIHVGGVDFDTIRILPKDPVTAATTQETKHKLLRRLHDQVELHNHLIRDTQLVDQAENSFFHNKLKQQTEQEEAVRKQRQQSERQALLADWKQQQALKQLRQQLLHPSKARVLP